MAASEKVYVCGRCEDYGAPNLEELVSHMTNCTKQLQKPPGTSETSHDNENSSDVVMQEDNENSENDEEGEDEASPNKSENSAIEITDVKSSPQSSVRSISKEGNRSTSPTPFIWNQQTARLLLELVKDHKKDMESPYIKRKTVWHRIALDMQRKHGYFVNASQCENKFKNMTNRYKRTKERNMLLNGKSKQFCFLYHELDEFYKNDEKFKGKYDQGNESIYEQYEPQVEIRYEQRPEQRYEPRIVQKELPRLMPKELPRIAPKIVRTARYVEPSYQFISSDQLITVPAITTPQKITIPSTSSSKDTEPVWGKKVVESIEKWHKESMAMQREFIDVLKQLVEKKNNDESNADAE